MKKVFITDYIKNPDVEKKIIGNLAEIICLNNENEKDFPEDIKNADALLVWHTKISNYTAKKLKNCKAIVRYGVGYENIDRESLKKHSILFANTPDYGVDEVADTSSAIILNLIRKILFYNNQTREKYKLWQNEVVESNRVNSIIRTSDHKLGIIGLGRIGSALALRMKAFKMEVAFYDPYVVSGYEKTLNLKRYETLEDLAKNSTIISVNAALNQETKNIINDNFVSLLKDNTIFINTARGEIVESLDVLMRGLKSNKLGAIGLDVLPKEPPDGTEPFFKKWLDQEPDLRDKVIINPHAAYYSLSSILEMRIKAAENIANVLRGNKLKNIINL